MLKYNGVKINFSEADECHCKQFFCCITTACQHWYITRWLSRAACEISQNHVSILQPQLPLVYPNINAKLALKWDLTAKGWNCPSLTQHHNWT